MCRGSRFYVVVVPLGVVLGLAFYIRLTILLGAAFSIHSASDVTDYDIRIRDYDIREGFPAYWWSTPPSLEDSYPTDEEGVILFVHRGRNYYSPVVIGQKTLKLLASYRLTGEEEYLDRAKLFADKLVEVSAKSRRGRYFPYHFDWVLNRHKTVRAPWYSGMAQGLALMIFVRLYKMTDEDRYLTLANEVFDTFKSSRSHEEPWTVYVDEDGYYWIEEYPEDKPSHVLNGHIAGIYGLYDYYLFTRSHESKRLLQAAITTVQHYLYCYREESGISSYSMKYGEKNARYHRLHMRMFNWLFNITGDDYFQTAHAVFYGDHPMVLYQRAP
jgi:hypothetical protein